LRNELKKSRTFYLNCRNSRAALEGNLLIPRLELHHASKNSFIGCKVCLESGCQHLDAVPWNMAKVNCRRKMDLKFPVGRGLICNKIAATHAKLVDMMIRPVCRINYCHFLCIGYIGFSVMAIFRF
jgi:hypothetical protein